MKRPPCSSIHFSRTHQDFVFSIPPLGKRGQISSYNSSFGKGNAICAKFTPAMLCPNHLIETSRIAGSGKTALRSRGHDVVGTMLDVAPPGVATRHLGTARYRTRALATAIPRATGCRGLGLRRFHVAAAAGHLGQRLLQSAHRQAAGQRLHCRGVHLLGLVLRGIKGRRQQILDHLPLAFFH